MRSCEKWLYMLGVIVFCTATTTSYASTEMKSSDLDLPQIVSDHNGSYALVIAEAESDSSSVSFYSCSISDLETQELDNASSVDVDNCESPFKVADGKPLTVSKTFLQNLQNKESQAFLSQRLDQLNQLYESDISDMDLKQASQSLIKSAFLGVVTGLDLASMVVGGGGGGNKASRDAFALLATMISGEMTVDSLVLAVRGLGNLMKSDSYVDSDLAKSEFSSLGQLGSSTSSDSPAVRKMMSSFTWAMYIIIGAAFMSAIFMLGSF
ncbi:MAG: hypothetical protein OXC44_00760 [Proteobacteria bacterium]|nr:hypothetical protein [Pseudomonadota bacterium]